MGNTSLQSCLQGYFQAHVPQVQCEDRVRQVFRSQLGLRRLGCCKQLDHRVPEKPPEEHLYKGTGDCFKKIAAEEGMAAGLYKGFMANVLRSVGGALVLVFYDRAKVYLEL